MCIGAVRNRKQFFTAPCEIEKEIFMKTGKKLSYLKKYELAGWLFVVPFLLFFSAFMIYPMIDSFYLTFNRIEGLNTRFVGLDNYVRLINDTLMWRTLGNTFLFTVTQVFLMLLLAMILAMLVNNKWLRFKGAFRTSLFLPCVMALVAYSVIFMVLFSADGIVNDALIFLGIIETPLHWLRVANPARAVIIMALIWRWTGYNMMFFLAYLQNIDQATFEAADVDGASGFQKFIHVIFPQMKPIVLFCALMTTIGTLQVFDETYNITRGGPNFSTMSISHYIYLRAFEGIQDIAYAATVSYLMVLILVFLAIIEFRIMRDDN